MTTSHTPGRLYVVESDEHWGRVNCHITAEHDDAMLGSIWCGSTAQNRADARRLVACWNACQNVETEVLEQHALGVIGAEASAELKRLTEAHDWQHKMAGERLRRIEKLESQRDDLLEALKDLMYWDNGKPEWEAARAAIAKAEGKA